MENDQAQSLPEMWAIVELFGHQKVAGKLSTLNLGAACLIRVTIPEVTRKAVRWSEIDGGATRIVEDVISPEHDRLFGVGAIYSINPCTEKTVRAVLKTMQTAPISSYDMDRMKMLSAGTDAPGVDANQEPSADCADSADPVELEIDN
jgi:hypothetical protein